MPVQWTTGYTQTQLDEIQEKFGLVFPADLVQLLRDRRPVGGHNWTNEITTRRMLDWPFQSLADSVETNAIWWPEWGQRPDNPTARKEVLRSIVSRAPKLIPLLSHRYLPEEGNPVFSVFGSDVIYYGTNLTDYFERENTSNAPSRRLVEFKHVPFWSELVERYGDPRYKLRD